MAARSASRLSETESSTGVCASGIRSPCVFRLTVNEPWCVSILGYGRGVFAPGRSSDRGRSPKATPPPNRGCASTTHCLYAIGLLISPHRVGHSVILSHAYAIKLYREEFKAVQGGQIGITLNGDWAMPYNDSPH
jgi:beta-glucosidase